MVQLHAMALPRIASHLCVCFMLARAVTPIILSKALTVMAGCAEQGVP